MTTRSRAKSRLGFSLTLFDQFAVPRGGPSERSRGTKPRHAPGRRPLAIESLERRDVPTVLPNGFAESIIAENISSPTAMEIAPDGRIFVAEQGGDLRVIKNDTLLAAPFVSLNVDLSGERGLLGIAFDPSFNSNNFVYLYYTTNGSPVHNRVSRFTANGDVATANSEVVILNLPNLSGATNHNGGAIHFGTDGKLYVAVGDNANSANSQSFNTRLGKMLRINSDGTNPDDNPFGGQTSGVNRAIWATGLRNPFTFAFQPATTRMFINDVGQETFEEINDGIAGSNYGWPTCEGDCNPPNGNFRDPLFQYEHGGNNTEGCAIAGGAFYNPAVVQFPNDFFGDYFFADLCNAWIRRYDPVTDTATEFATSLPGFTVDLKVDAAGRLYYLDRDAGAQGGIVARIAFTVDQPPGIVQHPADASVVEGQPATFRVSVSGTPPLAFQWQRDGADIPGANQSTFTIQSPTLADSGAMFRVMVSNDFGDVLSNTATLTVTMNEPPTGTITSPVVGAMYSGGDRINFAGTATDPDDGSLPASAFTWQVDFHHADHTHPFMPATSGITSGSFTIPTQGETAADVFYRVTLTVRNSAGVPHTSTRDVSPRTATISLATMPTGLAFTLDGQPQTTPFSVLGVAGIIRTLGVTTPQMRGGVTYAFDSWSDGRPATHDVATPPADSTFTAMFKEIPAVSFDLAMSSGSEAVKSFQLSVSVSAAALHKIQVNYAVTGGTATGGGADFVLKKGKLKFRPGQSTRLINFTVRNDALQEPDETIIVSLSGPKRAVLGANGTHTFTILDNDPPRIAAQVVAPRGIHFEMDSAAIDRLLDEQTLGWLSRLARTRRNGVIRAD